MLEIQIFENNSRKSIDETQLFLNIEQTKLELLLSPKNCNNGRVCLLLTSTCFSNPLLQYSCR